MKGPYSGHVWKCTQCRHEMHSASKSYIPPPDSKVTVVYIDTLKHHPMDCEEYQVYKLMES